MGQLIQGISVVDACKMFHKWRIKHSHSTRIRNIHHSRIADVHPTQLPINWCVACMCLGRAARGVVSLQRPNTPKIVRTWPHIKHCVAKLSLSMVCWLGQHLEWGHDKPYRPCHRGQLLWWHLRGLGKGHNGYRFDCSLLGLDIGNVTLLKNEVTYYTHIHRWR